MNAVSMPRLYVSAVGARVAVAPATRLSVQRAAVSCIQGRMSGEVCKPNISASGRRRRRLVGYVAAAFAVATIAAFVGLHVAWQWRSLVFLPAALAATGFLQASRNTCIAHASKGTFEHEDFTATKAPDDEVAASRKVASGIRRDAVLVGLATAALSVALAFLVG